MIAVRSAKKSDIDALVPKLREADIQEIKAVSGNDPLTALQRGVIWSDPCYTIIDTKDRPLALFGVVPNADQEGFGIVWLVASNELAKYSFTFLRHSRAWVEKLQQRYDVLWNCVDARNEVHIRWLKWCDFTFPRRIEEYGVEQRAFFEVSRTRDSGKTCRPDTYPPYNVL